MEEQVQEEHLEQEPIEEPVEEQIDENVDEPVEEPAVEQAVIDRARRQGWVPKEEFRGDPGRWIDANVFVQRADEIMPILKETNRRLETKLTALEERLAKQSDMVTKMVDIQNKYTDTSYKTQIQRIKERKLEAVRTGDEELFQKLEEQEAQIEKPPVFEKPAEQSPITPTQQQELNAWFKANDDWYGKDKDLTDYAMFISDKMVKQEGSTLQPIEFVEEVKARVKKAFPHKFEKKRVQDVDDTSVRGSGAYSTGTKKGWNDLPEEAKNQCIKMTKEIPGFTKEKYIKEYFEEA